MTNKRGFSHVEIIVSFVFFISFLSFAFFFFNPFQSRESINTNTDYLFDEMEKNSTIDLERYSVFVKSELSLVSIPSPSRLPEAGASAEDNKGNILNAWATTGIVTFENPENNFVVLKFSEDFARGFFNGELLSSENYTISSSETKKLFSEKRLILLNNSYYSDYNALKGRFGLPERTDFGFSVVFDDGTRIEGDRNKPDNIGIYSERKRVELIRKDGRIVFADLVIKIW